MKTTHSLKGMQHLRLLSTRNLLAAGIVSTAFSGIGVLQGDLCSPRAGALSPVLQCTIRKVVSELAVAKQLERALHSAGLLKAYL